MSYLSDLLRIEQIQLQLRGADKAATLRELVGLVPELRGDSTQSEAFLQSLIERERMHTTGIGDGIALPHARTPAGGVLKRPLLVFGRHSSGVPYDAVDRKPVHLFFLLGSPNLTDHLAMLSKLSRVLRDPIVRSGLLEAEAAEEIVRVIDRGESRTVK
jgi:mannitol/fructose-specific phosphotransferase system IIA component (Ntr-type)